MKIIVITTNPTTAFLAVFMILMATALAAVSISSSVSGNTSQQLNGIGKAYAQGGSLRGCLHVNGTAYINSNGKDVNGIVACAHQ